MKRKIKNIILKGITAAMVGLFFIGIGATEPTFASVTILFVSITWILLFTIANKHLFE